MTACLHGAFLMPDGKCPHCQKWCSYCEEDTHNDSECHCTRPVDWNGGKGWRKIIGGWERV